MSALAEKLQSNAVAKRPNPFRAANNGALPFLELPARALGGYLGPLKLAGVGLMVGFSLTMLAAGVGIALGLVEDHPTLAVYALTLGPLALGVVCFLCTFSDGLFKAVVGGLYAGAGVVGILALLSGVLPGEHTPPELGAALMGMVTVSLLALGLVSLVRWAENRVGHTRAGGPLLWSAELLLLAVWLLALGVQLAALWLPLALIVAPGVLYVATQVYAVATLRHRLGAQVSEPVRVPAEARPAQARAAADRQEPEVAALPEPLPRESVDDVLAELYRLPGLQGVKSQVRELAARLEHVAALKKAGRESKEGVGLHVVFMGSPGTGKTVVARIYVRLLYAMGLLERGHLVETDSSGFISENVGQTALKTNSLIDKALGGALFEDEAYARTPTKGAHDFAGESIATFIKRLEDDRESFAYIGAGYTDEMKKWLEGNPGIKSRISTYLTFEDYEPVTLMEILMQMLADRHYVVSPEAKDALTEYVQELYDDRDKNWGNAREMRNLADALETAQAVALSGLTVSIETRLRMEVEAVASARQAFQARRAMSNSKPKPKRQPTLSELSDLLG